MGVAGLMFEPHPPNFENLYNLWRCSNDAKTFFWYLYWFQIYKKWKRVLRPSIEASMTYPIYLLKTGIKPNISTRKVVCPFAHSKGVFSTKKSNYMFDNYELWNQADFFKITFTRRQEQDRQNQLPARVWISAVSPGPARTEQTLQSPHSSHAQST